MIKSDFSIEITFQDQHKKVFGFGEFDTVYDEFEEWFDSDGKNIDEKLCGKIIRTTSISRVSRSFSNDQE